MKELRSSSEMACRSVGLDPTGDPAETSSQCTFCGCDINPGDIALANPLKGKTSFMDDPSLATRSNYACGWCASLMPRQSMAALRSAVVTAEGAYPLNTDAARTWYFLDPPPPPHVAGITSLDPPINQHLFWRTPPTLDNDLLIVRFGNELFSIRRQRLLDAVKACRRASQLLTEVNGKKTIPHPYQSLDRKMTSLSHGRFRDDALKLERENTEMAELLTFLRGCNSGEIWALSILAKTTPDEPLKPKKITL